MTMHVILLVLSVVGGFAVSCLQDSEDLRIVGGTDASIEDYPYQLSLQVNGQHTCGASIIGSKWALTAGHCTEGVPAKSLSVRAGSSIVHEGGQVLDIKKIYIHPQFSLETMDYDISVLELSDNFDFNRAVQPVNLVSRNQQYAPGLLAVVTGWGVTEEGVETPSQHLKMVELPLMKKDLCNEEYHTITDRMICAGYEYGGRDSCQGDSGGPLAVNNTQIGIVSWGYGCARPEEAGVYSSVAALRDFVTEISGI